MGNTKDNGNLIKDDAELNNETKTKKLEYSSPKFVEYGNLVNLTLGITGGVTDTGGQGLNVP